MRDVVCVGDVLHLLADLSVHDQHQILVVLCFVGESEGVKHIVGVHFDFYAMLVPVLVDL